MIQRVALAVNFGPTHLLFVKAEKILRVVSFSLYVYGTSHGVLFYSRTRTAIPTSVVWISAAPVDLIVLPTV